MQFRFEWNQGLTFKLFQMNVFGENARVKCGTVKMGRPLSCPRSNETDPIF